MAQWWPLPAQNDEDSRSLVRSFLDVFPHASAWTTELHEVLLVGSASPLELDGARVERRWAQPEVAGGARRGGHRVGGRAAGHLAHRPGGARALRRGRAAGDRRPPADRARGLGAARRDPARAPPPARARERRAAAARPTRCARRSRRSARSCSASTASPSTSWPVSGTRPEPPCATCWPATRATRTTSGWRTGSRRRGCQTPAAASDARTGRRPRDHRWDSPGTVTRGHRRAGAGASLRACS